MKKSLIYIAAAVLTAVSPYSALAGDGTETAVDNFAMEETSSEETSANETAIDEAKTEPEENMEDIKNRKPMYLRNRRIQRNIGRFGNQRSG